MLQCCNLISAGQVGQGQVDIPNGKDGTANAACNEPVSGQHSRTRGTALQP